MPCPATLRKHRLRMTKAQLIDQIDTLEQRAAAFEEASKVSPSMRAKANERYFANQELADLTRLMSENLYPAISVMPGGTVLYANDAAVAANGLFELHDKSMLTRNLVKTCAEASRTAKVQETELESGDQIFFLSIVPINGETYINIYGHDITERKRAEEALRDSERRYQAIMENLPTVVYQKVLHPDGSIEFPFVSEGLHEINSLDSEMLMKDPNAWHDLTHPDDVARLKQSNLISIEKMEDWHLEYRIVKPDGETRWVSGHSHIRKESNGDFIWDGVYLDITESKRVQDELRDNRELLKAVIDAAPAMISAKDTESKYVFINQYQAELYGVSKEDAIGKTSAQLQNRKYGAYTRKLDRKVIESGEALPYFEETHVDAVGVSRELLVTKVPLMDRQDDVSGVVTVALDISDRKRTEEALAEKEAQLRVALDNMAGGIKLVDRDLNYVLFNAQYSQLCDYPDDLLRVGGSIVDELRYQVDRGDYGSGDKEELIEEVLAVYRKGEAASWERTIASSGRMLEIYIAPTPEGGYVSILTDITAVIESQRVAKLLQEAIDNFSDMVILYDKDERVVFSNDSYHEIYPHSPPKDEISNFSMEELFRRTLKKGQIADPVAKSDPKTWLQSVLSKRRVVEGGSGETTHVDGRTYIFRHRYTTEGGIILTQTDITERKQAEEALREAKRQLEESMKLVAEKNEMLESLSNKLSKYLPPQVYGSIFSGEQTVEIASKRKKLTVFFSDIADFTEITVSLESEELTDLLNHYLTEMSKVALEYGATIDKYVGDGITAFFGDPDSRGVKEDAKACVNMAIAMQRRLQELQSKWLDRGLEEPFRIRIGINTGFCTVGNFGSEDRMDYTINGSEVNLASRLETHADVGGIFLAHETYSLVKDTVFAEERDPLTVKGFPKPVRCYAVVGLHDDLALQDHIIRREQEGLALVIDRTKLTRKGLNEAIETLEDVLSKMKR